MYYGDREPLWECVNSKKINHDCVPTLCNECYSNDADIPDKTCNRRATTADNDHDVTVCNHTLELVSNSCKLGYAKEYQLSCIQKGDKISVQCNSCHN